MGPTVAYFLRFTAIFDPDILLLLLGSKILLLGWEHILYMLPSKKKVFGRRKDWE